ncbi:MAG: hypothetical protein COZ70_07110 [Deltaproteobacteria bacterium CG_4_8_14_3_um_filter_51_11]|nr:sulfurtransferase [bacterium]OIP38947.1 MAG: hypothetical protein AUK25_11760 [Desulfobacteraceae bacterium CG2_30_51_40]PIP47739.1 MAG: hypothetical protein COX16_03250 [Deltaproteobacteria bacterium CG23_combo_of_CG06-09_8_20_14_all_51_20]PIW01190.1 MAG: hypothetical protein COW41_03235 [Deltaproteobacteria bacterium CG17_big_fil_post_rev_8_21_14_2_50_51_6]PIX19792.1 MAG: hypothetical protein COZ70_07110 [Deltaproteobacteria bacterium CG_4_8_14_3_um_filter_51_11]PIY23659.1 MAG: hypothetic
MAKRFRLIGTIGILYLIISAAGALAVENGGYTESRFLVTTQWLSEHLSDPGIRILDRQDIEPVDAFYAKGHIANSIRMPTSAIKGMKDGVEEMLILKDLISFLEAKGVSSDHHIILVGRSQRLPATTRVFWALEMLGHEKMSVLDGGIDKWMAEKRPLVTESPNFPEVKYSVKAFNRNRLMTAGELEGYIGIFDRLNLVVVDSRRPDEFVGKEMSRAGEKLGRIPGSSNLMFMQLLTGENYKEFKSAVEIRDIFQAKGIAPDKHIAFTCVSGCFGTVDYFAARLLGYTNVSVYDGAWIEWCKKGYPVEIGSPGQGKVVRQGPAKTTVPKRKPRASDGC